MRNPTYYSVIPTYSAGSSAQVDRETAERVAVQEREARERIMEGWYGERAQAAAGLRELSGIAYAWTERGTGAEVRDLITGEVRTFKKFLAFQEWGKAMRLASATYRVAEYGQNVEVAR